MTRNGQIRVLTTREFVTEHANDPYCGDASITGGKPGPVYANDKHGALIRQAVIKGALQKLLLTSLRSAYCTWLTILFFVVTQARDDSMIHCNRSISGVL